MEKLKLMTIIGTRPEIIRLSEVIKLADRYFNHVLVHTGQNWDYSLNKVFFEDLELRNPDFYLNSAGDNLGQTMGNIISMSYQVMKQEKPDAVLVLGDTNSALSTISAKRLKIPIFHMEAGNRCWDWNVSEMINRKIVDHISDINMPYTEHARRYLISEGIDAKNIFVTGSPMREVLQKNIQKIEKSDVLEKLELKKNNYIVVSSHREENIDNEKNFISLMEAINNIAKMYNMPIIFSTHPRTKNIINKRNFKFNSLVKNVEPFGFIDYNKLQKNSFCVVSDSGTLSEESAILGFTGVLIRTSTERPEVLDKGSIIIGGITTKTVIQAIELAISMKNDGDNIEINKEYEDINVSSKVIKIIQSYEDIVNRTIWRKDSVY